MNVFVLIIVGLAGVGLGVYLARHSSAEKLRRGEAKRGRGEVKKATPSFAKGYGEAMPSFAKGYSEAMRGVVKERSAAKEENVERVRALARGRGRITNDDVERALGVSDATATRYLEELEQEGVLRQVGAEGRHVYYEPR